MNGGSREQGREGAVLLGRRDALASAAACGVSALGFAGEGLAVVGQGLLAGRIPGLSDPHETGWFLLPSGSFLIPCNLLG